MERFDARRIRKSVRCFPVGGMRVKEIPNCSYGETDENCAAQLVMLFVLTS